MKRIGKTLFLHPKSWLSIFVDTAIFLIKRVSVICFECYWTFFSPKLPYINKIICFETSNTWTWSCFCGSLLLDKAEHFSSWIYPTDSFSTEPVQPRKKSTKQYKHSILTFLFIWLRYHLLLGHTLTLLLTESYVLVGVQRFCAIQNQPNK